MNDITELSLIVGRIEQKTDHQTKLLTEIKTVQDDMNVRLSNVEQSRAFWKKLTSGIAAVGGFVLGLIHGSR